MPAFKVQFVANIYQVWLLLLFVAFVYSSMITSQRSAPGLNVFAAVKRPICCLRLVVIVQLVEVYSSDWLLSIPLSLV